MRLIYILNQSLKAQIQTGKPDSSKFFGFTHKCMKYLSFVTVIRNYTNSNKTGDRHNDCRREQERVATDTQTVLGPHFAIIALSQCGHLHWEFLCNPLSASTRRPDKATRKYSTQTKAVNSPAITSPVCSRVQRSQSPWMAEDGAWTISSLSGHGARSSTKLSICMN